MKKIIAFVLVLVTFVVLGACVELEVSDVTSIELSWQPNEAYEVSTTNESLVGKAVKVNFEDGTSQTFQYGDANLSVSGSGYTESGETPYLVTDSVGEKNIRVSYGGVTVDVYYYVADIVVGPSDDVKALVEGAASDETVYISTGEYHLAGPVSLEEEGVTVIGPKFGEAKISSLSTGDKTNYIAFSIVANDITIKNLTITTGVWSEGYPAIIEIIGSPSSGAGYPTPTEVQTNGTGYNATIDNCLIYGSYALNRNYDTMKNMGIRVVESSGGGYNATVGKLTVTNNTIYNVRQAIQLGYTQMGIINSNTIFHTKGGILLNAPDASFITDQEWENNNWTSTVEGYRSHNEADITYHTKQWTNGGIDYSVNLTLSSNNNGAHIQDRRWCKFGVDSNCTLGNGAGVPDNDGVTPVNVEGVNWYVFDSDGSPLDDINHPDAVYIYNGNSFENGTRFNRTHMTIREYEENEFYDVSADILRADNGNVREAIWVEINGGSYVQERAKSIELAVTGLTPGGTMVEWINDEWVTIDPSEYTSS
jgi:hypothetical protein